MEITPFQAVYPNFDLIASADSFFSTVKYEYPQYVESGFFIEDNDEALFVQEIKTPDRTHYGLLCCLDIREFEKGKILQHEKTMASKEQKITTLLLQRKAMIKPVLLTYEPRKDLLRYLKNISDKQKPFYKVKFDDEDQVHRIFKVSDPDMQKEIAALLSDVNKLYIADGHHRISTSAKLYRNYAKRKKNNLDFQNLLSVLFAFDQLGIHDYNRIVEILDDVKPAVVVAQLSEICDIRILKSAAKPVGKFTFTMYMDHVWYELRWKQSLIEKYDKDSIVLDANIMNKEIFKKIFHIRNISTDDRIKYVEGTVGIDVLIDKTQKGQGRVGFCLFPITMEEFVAVADAGKVLPPKSTWFEPRIKNGLIAKRF
jgi:uncharacterized protein (DUF1015 family)